MSKIYFLIARLKFNMAFVKIRLMHSAFDTPAAQFMFFMIFNICSAKVLHTGALEHVQLAVSIDSEY